jgi:hypothetical protein
MEQHCGYMSTNFNQDSRILILKPPSCDIQQQDAHCIQAQTSLDTYAEDSDLRILVWLRIEPEDK